MKTKIDELMALADEYANHCRGWQPIDNKYREVLRETLEAALNPMGEPIYQLRSMVGNWIDQSQDSYEYNTRQGWTTRILYTAPPAQTKRLDSDESRLTPPPRLSDEQISDIAVSTPPNVHTYGRAIETAVRKQFGVQE